MKFVIESGDLLNEDSRYLQKFAGNVTTQCGEDGIFAEIFRRIGVKHAICCDVGASDGLKYSNSWRLIHEENWSGVLIEGSTDRYDSLAALYEIGEYPVALINAIVQHTGDTLDSILGDVGVPPDFDFLSIDVDGIDWHIWESLKNYQPRLVCIEFNPSIPNNVTYVQDADINIQQGASLRAMIELGKRKGYELAGTTQFNAMFVLAEDFPAIGIKDNSIHAMHTPGEYESVRFQFYDGTFGQGGRMDAIWTAE